MKVSDEILFLEEAFDVLNQRFFESALSRPAITIQSTPGAHGHLLIFEGKSYRMEHALMRQDA